MENSNKGQAKKKKNLDNKKNNKFLIDSKQSFEALA